MQRYFNTEGNCIPKYHYMVNIDSRLEYIQRFFIERGKYFVINRGRQYGKTTTLKLLAKYLNTEYIAISMDFQEIGTADFKDEASFCRAFSKIFVRAYQGLHLEGMEPLAEPVARFIQERENATLLELFVRLSAVCKDTPKPVILLIDEVDSASNHQVFLDFLALLRTYYLDRENKPIFQSVILAGVYDIKNLKLKIRPDSEHPYNSPWNIAADFDVAMDFSAAHIAAMLQEYEADSHTGMNCGHIAEEIYQYTSGYPYLVSAICKLLDEKIPERTGFEHMGSVWTKQGVAEAVKIMTERKHPLFESMARQLTEYPDMKGMLHAVLFQGKRISYNPDQESINLASMFGFIKNSNNHIQIANRIFEMRMYNLFLSEEELTNAIYNEAQGNRNQFIQNSRLNMDLVLEKFVTSFTDIYGDNDQQFIEDYGRKFFLLYLRPIINGVGNYYIEAQTRDARRTDVIVDYRGEQFIVELKIWHGNEYLERGEGQLADYLAYYRKNKGYLISFNFNKNKNVGVKRIEVEGKQIVEAVI